MSKLRAYQTTAATKKVGSAFFKAPKNATIYREVLTNLKKLLPGAKWEGNYPVQYPDKNADNDDAWNSSINYKGVVINIEEGRYNYIIYELASKMRKAHEVLEDALEEDVDIYVSFPYEDNSARLTIAVKKLIEESAKIKKVMNEVQTALVKAIRMVKK